MPKKESSGPLTTSNRNPWGAAPKKVPVPSTGASSTAARSKPVIAQRAPAHPTKAVTKKPTTASASAKMSSKPTAGGYATRSLKLRLPTENEMAVHKAKTTTVARSFDPARPRANYFGRYPIDLSPEDVCEENRNLPVFNINPIVESSSDEGSSDGDSWEQMRRQMHADSQYARDNKKARNKKPPKSPQRLSPYKFRMNLDVDDPESDVFTANPLLRQFDPRDLEAPRAGDAVESYF